MISALRGCGGGSPKRGHERNPKKACQLISASLIVNPKLSAAKQRNLGIMDELALEENIFLPAVTLRCSKLAATKQ